ncbi:Dps family protein [Rhizobium ruizarguesonis]|uniref:Dps family protein n=1 Tax=Rhizobium ruizarguesonis TaxID=2081791 RepID=UPI001FEDB564|nr:DNA starvation/stationary phase protection protein [Rhizobium ruizarguesonis]
MSIAENQSALMAAAPSERTTHNTVQALSEKINQILADSFALYLKTKNFHWHVKGPHFRDYHLMLDQQADGIFKIIDPLAERVRALGGTTIRSLGQVMSLRTIADNDKEHLAPRLMLEELIRDTKLVTTSMRQALKLCDDIDDVATASLIEGYIEAAEKRIWFLRETVGAD